MMNCKIELMTAILSYMSGQIEFDEFDKRIEEIFSKVVYEKLKEKGVIE